MRKTIPVAFIFVAFLFSFVLSSCAHISTQVPVDSDNDGVFDNYDYRYDLHFITPQYYDQCPTSTPMGVKVDKDGCPLDSDGDGVPDYLDKCSETPTGVKVDKDGCPIAAVVSAVEKQIVEKGVEKQIVEKGVEKQIVEKGRATMNVEFDFDKAVIKKKYHDKIGKLAEVMKKYSDLKIVIEGHTDNIGGLTYNEKLSQGRADAVKQYLVEKFGIEASRLSTKGYGEIRPIESNATKEGCQKNRRVEAVAKYIIKGR